MFGVLTAIAAIIAFAATFALGYIIIPLMHKLKYGQTILEIGPKWHKNKQGTPTMGGIMFVLGLAIALLVTMPLVSLLGSDVMKVQIQDKYHLTTIISGLALALSMSLIGFIDDYIKVVKKQNLGLTAKQKTFLQLLVSAAYLTSMYLGGMRYTRIPFIGAVPLTEGVGLLFWPIALVFVYGFTNAVNLTDGIDGLASAVTIVAAIFLAFISQLVNNDMCGFLSLVFAASLLGFFIWNKNPAKVFMGDTGSMFLGGMVVALAFMTEYPIILIFTGIIYLCEALSVVIQVAYFKKTGKRIFKMSPIHHHFELSKWSENKIDIVFSLVGALGGLLSMVLIVFGK